MRRLTKTTTAAAEAATKIDFIVAGAEMSP
jgi:hypothetical protein